MQLIFTIGHSTRSLDELVGLLRQNGVTRLADIRRYPGSAQRQKHELSSFAAIAGDHVEYPATRQASLL